MTRSLLWLSALLVPWLALVPACGDDSDDAARPLQLQVVMAADFGAAANVGGSFATLLQPLEETCPTPAPADDLPIFAPGLDCDGDGGVVRYITPSELRVAFKRLSFVHERAGAIDVIADTGTLAEALVLDLTEPLTVATVEALSGHYVMMEAEIYYFELTLDGAGPRRIVRVYMSDDDFPGEGELGHHQGDITLIDEDGAELGFVVPAAGWTEEALSPTRGELRGGAPDDAETGHSRGLFGDGSFWNRGELNQGPDQDIYLLLEPISADLVGDEETVTVRFDVADTWFFEDFGDNGSFDPCVDGGGVEACAPGSAWGPLFAPPRIELP
jgi:hypothetical protein